MTKAYAVTYDERVTCPKCQQSYQLLDWQCALHQLSCGAVAVPTAEQQRISEHARMQGVSIRWS